MRWIVVLLLLAATFGITPALAQSAGGVRGTVFNTATTRPGPIRNAVLTVLSRAVIASTTTDANGFFVFMSLPPGRLDIEVRADGYTPVTVPVCVQSGVFRTLPIILSPGGSLSQLAANSKYNQSLQYRPDPGIIADLYSIGDC